MYLRQIFLSYSANRQTDRQTEGNERPYFSEFTCLKHEILKKSRKIFFDYNTPLCK